MKGVTWVTHTLTATGALVLLLILAFFLLYVGTQLPGVGGVFSWAGQHASGSAEGF